METAITALIILAVVLSGMLTMLHSYLSSQDTILESWREMEERLGERARTEISLLEATTDPGDNDTVTVILENEGSTRLADFDQWDVIVQYEGIAGGNVVKWLTYEEGVPGTDQWTEDIGDIFEPCIFNPGEVMTITIELYNLMGQSVTNTVAIATPNGISASTVFAH